MRIVRFKSHDAVIPRMLLYAGHLCMYQGMMYLSLCATFFSLSAIFHCFFFYSFSTLLIRLRLWWRCEALHRCDVPVAIFFQLMNVIPHAWEQLSNWLPQWHEHKSGRVEIMNEL